jgi:hypothetical protein
LAVCSLAEGIVLVAPVAAATWLASLDASHSWAATSDQLPVLVERVRHAQGEVLADPLDVIALADRQPVFEPLLFTRFYESGHWAALPVVEQICNGQVGLVVLGQPIERIDWPAPVREAVEQATQLDGSFAGRLVYTPRGDRQAALCLSRALGR